MLQYTHRLRLRAKFLLNRFTQSPSTSKRTANFTIFGLRYFAVSPIGGVWKKLNARAQLQTFPCAKVSKLWQNRVQKLCPSKVDGHTNTQTKIQHYWPPGGR